METEASPRPPRTGSPPAPFVRAAGLTKTYPARRGQQEFRAVDGIDFEVRAGEVFGFLGPNGAGKSTTMRMIGAISPRTSGSLTVLGMDPDTHGSAIRARLGVVPQDDALDRELTVRENLFIYGRYFDLSRSAIRDRSAELLDFAQLGDKADSPVESLSGGMRRRLTIARSLVNRPSMVLLDEPTTGLDPQARHVLWDRLYRLKQDGVTLLLTTHYMDEAEQLCDRLMVVDHGGIVAQGSPGALMAEHVTREVLEVRFPLDTAGAAATALRASPMARAAGGGRVEVLPDRVLVYTDDGEAALAAVHSLGLVPLTALVRRSTLEDVFLTLTGRSLVD
ncbi:ABC transporter ATP-binding protein [Streptomyces sp. NPDC021224]|uniref:ABC transporter ATP-binding protein n=1 Tax=unclassified Streptomyces TaxID=2593676 RepID=UPI0037AAE7D7